MGVIYALCDPATDEIRYVGKTVQQVRRRLQRHLGEARGGSNRHLCNWIRSLDGPPKVLVLEETNRLDEAERDWIAGLRSIGYRLTNLTDGGDGIPPGTEPWHKGRTGVYSEESIARMRESHLGKPSGNRGKKHPGVNAGMKHTEETKAKLRDAWVRRKLRLRHTRHASDQNDRPHGA